jgi:hypothetical protein
VERLFEEDSIFNTGLEAVQGFIGLVFSYMGLQTPEKNLME